MYEGAGLFALARWSSFDQERLQPISIDPCPSSQTGPQSAIELETFVTGREIQIAPKSASSLNLLAERLAPYSAHPDGDQLTLSDCRFGTCSGPNRLSAASQGRE